MANGIIPVSWGSELRPSAVNTLDKINEVIHFINQSDIHEFTFSDSGSGESVQTANSTQLLDLTVYGKSVQDGTPTPDNPVEVQVVGGRNLVNWNVSPFSNALNVFLEPNDYTMSASSALGVGSWYIRATDTQGVLLTKDELGLTRWYGASTTGIFYGAAYSNMFTFTLPRKATVEIGKLDTDETIPAQLETGTQATPYTPYGCIGLQTGETVHPIDLQGHTLASLPDGTRDELDIDAAGVVSITQNAGYIASYDGESVGDIYISTTGQLTTGASVYYKLDTPQTIELGTIDPPAIPDGSIITVNASLTPTIDAKWFTEDTLPEMMNAILGLIKSLHPDDFPVNTLDVNIVHNINPIDIHDIQPIDIQPISDIRPISDIQPIEDIEIMQDENESEE